MTRTIAALLAAAATLTMAAPAAAQTKYYVRERIVGIPAGTTQSTTPPKPQCGSYVLNASIGGQKSYTILNISQMSVAAAQVKATEWCTSVSADACQLDNNGNFVIAYFGPAITICNTTSCSNNGRYGTLCTH